MKFTINKQNLVTEELLEHLINAAGFGVGIGEWRPDKDARASAETPPPKKP